MSHLLFIRDDTQIPAGLREAFSAPENRIVIRSNPHQAETAIKRGAFDAAVIYADQGEAHLSKILRELRDAQAELFTIVLSPEYSLSLETRAFDEGANLYFSKPFPIESLRRLIGQQWEKNERPRQKEASDYPVKSSQNEASTSTSTTLHVLRDLSHILSFSLDYKAFTQHFILKLRDHISFSRIGIFLEASAKQSLIKGEEGRHLKCIASIGLPHDLVDCFQLSREVGIGRELFDEPRILHGSGRTDTPVHRPNATVEKEFAILGCHLAIPISDREGCIGAAILNGPVTGRNFSNDELELLYLLMEELGLAIRNSRLHSELAQHGQLIENVLHSMSSGALVCSEDLQVLYANDAARRFLKLENDAFVDFGELPSKLAGPIHRSVEKGELPAPFQLSSPSGDRIYRASIFPFTQKGELVLLPRPTMIIIEDFTHIEASKQNAVDTSRSELITVIAERFAHEIRNSLVPLSTHAQLIEKKIEQPKFQASLKSALVKETARIKRFSDQMLYMAQSSRSGSEAVDLVDLVETAFERAKITDANSGTQLRLEKQSETFSIDGNGESLTHALEEIFLNSMQALSKPGEITVKLGQNNEGILQIRITDDGPGIPKEVVEHATKPFYTTRNTGIGLGLSVAEKIFLEHNGYLKLYPRNAEHDCDIEIELPLLLTTA